MLDDGAMSQQLPCCAIALFSQGEPQLSRPFLNAFRSRQPGPFRQILAGELGVTQLATAWGIST